MFNYSEIHYKKYLAVIVISSFLIKLILAFALHAELRSDSLTYIELASSLLHGSYELNHKPSAYVVPGYPLFLAGIYKIFGESQLAVRIVQSLLDSLTVIIFFLVSKKFFEIKFALLSAFIFAFLPSNILYSQMILTETLFGFFGCLVLCFCLAEKFPKNVFLLGILFAFAVLVRSSFSLMVILIPIYLYLYRNYLFSSKKLVPVLIYSLLFLIGLMLILSPWLVRNKIQLGTFTLATQAGVTFWEGNNPDATGTYNPEAFENNPVFDLGDEIEINRLLMKEGMDFVINNPHKFVILGIKKLVYLFSSERLALLYFKQQTGEQMTSTEVYRTINPVLILVVNLPYFFVMIIGVWGLIILKRYRFFVFGFITVWLITFATFVSLSRYHYVLIPFLVLGSVNFISLYKVKELSFKRYQKVIGVSISLFLVSIWLVEFYLVYFK